MEFTNSQLNDVFGGDENIAQPFWPLENNSTQNKEK